ncbi:DMT family transporter [Psychromarinibacter sp. S121]|uniref:DMT family transporter n=1 Tax=Psychromarinibacter sp. S121 TaxID=3415127 RepID=UPI003C7A65B4
MSVEAHPDASASTNGIGLMVLAMALLAVSDMFVKLAGGTQPPGQVMFLLSVGGTAFFVLLARLQGARVWDRRFWYPSVVRRNLFEIVAAFGLVLGLTYAPLSLVAALMQTTPLIVTMGAALILKEPVGPRRWAAVLVGLAGMLLVVRPWSADFAPSAVFVLVAVVGLAFRDLYTRLCPPEVPSVTLSTWGFAATMPFGLVLMLLMRETPVVSGIGLAHVAGAIVVTTTGYYAVTSAMRAAPVAVVAPFRYTRLIFTTGLGMLVFAERPDTLTYVGSAIILAAGLYTFLRERQLARRR